MTRTTLRHRAELLYLLVRKDVKVRYKSSVLGYLWAIINPFAFALVYWIAFKMIMRVQMENYSIFLITGMFPWIWLSAGVVQATRSFQNNSSLVKRVNLPRSVLPLSNIVQEMVHFVFALPVIAAFLVFAGGLTLHWSWLWQIPLMLLAQLVFAYPLALGLAVLNVFVHDIEYLVGIGFSLLFFATPIVYPITMIPDTHLAFFENSPLYHLVNAWRSIFMEGQFNWGNFEFVVVTACVFSLVALLIYRRLGPRIGEVL